MKRGKIAILVLIGVLVVAMAVAVPALAAKPRRTAHGGMRYIMVTGDPSNEANLHPAAVMFQLTELNKNGKAKGDYFFFAEHKQAGFMAAQGEILCVEFLGGGAIRFSGRITWRHAPFPNGCGDYFTVYMIDKGTPGSAGDEGAYYMALCEETGNMGFGTACNPCNKKTCDPGIMSPTFPVVDGDLVINE